VVSAGVCSGYSGCLLGTANSIVTYHRVIEHCEQRMNEEQTAELLGLLDEVLGPVQVAELADYMDEGGGGEEHGEEVEEDDPAPSGAS